MTNDQASMTSRTSMSGHSNVPSASGADRRPSVICLLLAFGSLLLVLVAPALGQGNELMALERVRKAYDAGQYQDVVRLAGEALRGGSANPQYYLMRGQAFAKLGVRDQAVQDFTSAIEVMPRLPTAYYWRGNAYEEMGRLDLAVKDYDLAIAYSPGVAQLHKKRSQVRLRLGMREGAADDLARVIELDRSALLDLATEYMKAGDTAFVVTALSKVSADSGSWEFACARGYVLRVTHEEQMANRAFADALKLGTASVEGAHKLAGWFISAGLHSWAARVYGWLEQAEPSEPQPSMQKGYALFRDGEPDSAVAAFTVALRKALVGGKTEAAAEACYRRAEVYTYLGRGKPAEDDFKTAAQLAPGRTFAKAIDSSYAPRTQMAAPAPEPAPAAVAAGSVPESVPAVQPMAAGAPTTARREGVFALVIGVSAYKSGAIRPVSYGAADAEAVQEMLVDPKRGGLPPENVKLVTASNATLAEVRRDISWLVNQARATGGIALVYFSGHGAPAQGANGEFKQAYLVPYDCDPDYLEETALSMGDVEQKLAELDGRAFVAMDACFSGKGRSFVKPGSKGVTLVPRNLGLKQEGRGVTFLTASKADQLSTEYDSGKHGLFTYYLLDGMGGKADDAGNQDGWVDASETYAYVRDKVKSEARRMNVDQEPELIGAASGLRLTCNYERLQKSSKDARIARLRQAYDAGSISSEQFERAMKDIRSGKESRTLRDFLDGTISVESFKDAY